MDGFRQFLSIVVVTRGRPELLRRCLSSLTNAVRELGDSDACRVAIQVEINGPDPESYALLQEMESTGPIRFRELDEQVTPGEARNRALSVRDKARPDGGADSDWVLFIDDDAFVDPGYLKDFLSIAERNPKAGVLGGPNLTPTGSSLFQRASGVALASRLATFFSSARYRALGSERPASEEDLILCNLFVRRRVLELPELGGRPFPPKFICGEENWLLAGLRDLGVPMIYSPILHVWHERRPRAGELLKQVFRYGEGRARCLVDRPRTVRVAHLVPSLCLLYALGLAAAPGLGIAVSTGWFLAPLIAYPVICLAAGFSSARRSGENTAVALAGGGVFPLIHAGYGIGVLSGLTAGLIAGPTTGSTAGSPSPPRSWRAELGLPAIWLATLWIYWPLIAADPVLNRDDVRTLKNLRGLSDFRKLAEMGEYDKLLIYQPIRDATLLLDRALSRAVGFGTVHLTNWLLWCAILAVGYSILGMLLPGRRWLRLGATALYAVHPVMVASVGWLSARKHLLATLFALGATRCFLRFRYRGGSWFQAAGLSLVLYVLSVLSHPIAILWPLWAVYYSRQLAPATDPGERAPRLWVVGAVGVPLALGAIILSFRYYTGLYVAHTLNLKIVGSASTTAPISLLAHGRYLFNLLMPIRLGTVYYPGTLWNLVGLFAAPFLFAALLTGPRGREARSWFAFYLFPLLPVTLAMTNVFVSDTYLLLPAFGLTVLIATFVDDHLSLTAPGEKAQKTGLQSFPAGIAILAAAAVFLFLTLGSREQALGWMSDRALWDRTYRMEPSPRSLAMKIQTLLQSGSVVEAREYLVLLHDWDSENPDYPHLLARAIYVDARLSTDEKIEVLSRTDQRSSKAESDPWFNYFYGAMLTESGRFRDAYLHYQSVLNNPETFEEQLAPAAAEAIKICRLAREDDCGQRLEHLRARISASPVLESHWSEAAFVARSAELDRSLATVAASGLPVGD